MRLPRPLHPPRGKPPPVLRASFAMVIAFIGFFMLLFVSGTVAAPEASTKLAGAGDAHVPVLISTPASQSELNGRVLMGVDGPKKLVSPPSKKTAPTMQPSARPSSRPSESTKTKAARAARSTSTGNAARSSPPSSATPPGVYSSLGAANSRPRSTPTPLSLEEDMVLLGWVSLIGVVLMVFVLLIAYALRQTKARWLPDSSVAMIAGVAIGAVVYMYDPNLVVPADGSPSAFAFSPRVFFFILLPPIILDAGYSLNKQTFFKNINTVVLYAGPGVIISTAVIGSAAWALSHIGVFGGTPFGVLESLMFGALLSVTDSVATISILGAPELNFDPNLFSVIFGESVLNDAVGILVFDTLAKYSRANTVTFSLAELSMSFVTVFVGSIALGVATGLLCAYAFKHLELNDYPHFEFLLICLFAYMSYILALVMQLSGVMSLFVCGVILGHYNWHNISRPSKTSTRYGFKAFSVVCEMGVFVYLGITFSFSITPNFHFRWSLLGCIVTFLLTWLGRAACVFPLSWIANTFVRRTPLSWPMQMIVFASGLRGAVSFALALNIHGEHFDVMITTTLAIVIFTSLVCGAATDRVVRHYSAEMHLIKGTRMDRVGGSTASPSALYGSSNSGGLGSDGHGGCGLKSGVTDLSAKEGRARLMAGQHRSRPPSSGNRRGRVCSGDAGEEGEEGAGMQRADFAAIDNQVGSSLAAGIGRGSGRNGHRGGRRRGGEYDIDGERDGGRGYLDEDDDDQDEDEDDGGYYGADRHSPGPGDDSDTGDIYDDFTSGGYYSQSPRCGEEQHQLEHERASRLRESAGLSATLSPPNATATAATTPNAVSEGDDFEAAIGTTSAASRRLPQAASTGSFPSRSSALVHAQPRVGPPTSSSGAAVHTGIMGSGSERGCGPVMVADGADSPSLDARSGVAAALLCSDPPGDEGAHNTSPAPATTDADSGLGKNDIPGERGPLWGALPTWNAFEKTVLQEYFGGPGAADADPADEMPSGH